MVPDPHSATAVGTDPDPAADVVLETDSTTPFRPDPNPDPDVDVVAEPYSATAVEPDLDLLVINTLCHLYRRGNALS